MMVQSYFNEVVNGHLTVFAAWAIFLFFRYTWNNLEKGYWELRPALAVLSICLADFLIRAPFWISRHYINIGLYPSSGVPMGPLFYVPITIGVLFKCWAVLCVIKVFTPDLEPNTKFMRHVIIWSILSSIILVEGWVVAGRLWQI